jgi:hypothetical protein
MNGTQLPVSPHSHQHWTWGVETDRGGGCVKEETAGPGWTCLGVPPFMVSWPFLPFSLHLDVLFSTAHPSFRQWKMSHLTEHTFPLSWSESYWPRASDLGLHADGGWWFWGGAHWATMPLSCCIVLFDGPSLWKSQKRKETLVRSRCYENEPCILHSTLLIQKLAPQSVHNSVHLLLVFPKHLILSVLQLKVTSPGGKRKSTMQTKQACH